ncbi:Alpha/Beta hydrolase protein [Blastocladiella britannica]|nr:Alpha/Beta hydrolase protein [Blastocladiella britannica]
MRPIPPNFHLARGLLGPFKEMLTAPVHEEDVRIDLPVRGVALHARIHHGMSNGASLSPRTGVIISHPYGPLGGDLRNNVVRELATAFARRGIPTLRYSMRGAGKSSGRTSWTAAAESDDLAALVDWWTQGGDTNAGPTWTADNGTCYTRAVPERVLLVGYSYGSLVSLPVARTHDRACGLIMVSPPAGVTWALTAMQTSTYSAPLPLAMPKLVVMGDKDQFSSEGTMVAFTAKVCGTEPGSGGSGGGMVLGSPHDNGREELVEGTVRAASADVVIVKDRDHFWVGEEDAIVDLVEAWVERTYGWTARPAAAAAATAVGAGTDLSAAF